MVDQKTGSPCAAREQLPKADHEAGTVLLNGKAARAGADALCSLLAREESGFGSRGTGSLHTVQEDGLSVSVLARRLM